MTKKITAPRAKSTRAKTPTAPKPAKYKIKLSLTPTFEKLVNPSNIGMYGFCYKITLQHPRDPSNTVYNYFGSKSLNHGKPHTHYQSSSEYVGRMLDAGFIPTYEILSYHGTKYALSQSEGALILSAWRDPAVRSSNRNHGLPLAGGRHMTRYMWCKQCLGIIDKWPY
jgi:hypothetical protein